ncbi:hypothetical protein RB195_021270 [Necator americanus]|uniref:Uncharacterized protein n=1 Tax=Necator americanus TaxID=51031 RepID=A0ABR1EA59_NECAM
MGRKPGLGEDFDIERFVADDGMQIVGTLYGRIQKECDRSKLPPSHCHRMVSKAVKKIVDEKIFEYQMIICG